MYSRLQLSSTTPWNPSIGIMATLVAMFSLINNQTVMAQPGPGTALRFDGVDGHVNIGDDPRLRMSDAFTISAWIFPTGDGGHSVTGGIVVNREGEYEIGRRNDGMIWFAVKVDSVGENPGWFLHETGFTAPPNQWSHIALVYDHPDGEASGQITFQGDGLSVTNWTTTGVLGDHHTAENEFQIGGRQLFPGTSNFNGHIDEVTVWNVARTEADIRAQMNQSLAGDEDGLVAYYRFDETVGGRTGDTSTNGLIGTLEGGTEWFPSVAPLVAGARIGPGSTLTFNGADQYIRGPNGVIPTSGNFTVECWVKAPLDADGSFRNILSQAIGSSGQRVYLGVAPSREIRVGDPWPNTGILLPMNNEWQHLAVVRTDLDIHLYLNGALVATKGSPYPDPTDNPFLIGKQFDPNGAHWKGNIDELRIWGVARSADEILENRHRSLPGHEIGLVAYYRFDEASGDLTGDATGNSLVGKLSNAPVWEPSDAPVSSITSREAEGISVAYSFSTFAGTTGGASADGVGSAARFFRPYGVTTDTDGNIFVADTANHTIRMITPSGVVTTIAGTPGALGGADNVGSLARFYNPQGIVSADTGRLFVADTWNHAIRLVEFDGINWIVKTVAGNRGQGTADGSGGPNGSARLTHPVGITVDREGTLYITEGRRGNGAPIESANHTIRMIKLNGLDWEVSTLAGKPGESQTVDGVGGTDGVARLNDPRGITVVGGSTNLYFTEYESSSVRRLWHDGSNWLVDTITGGDDSGYVNGTLSEAKFKRPHGIAADGSNNIFVADTFNNVLRKVTPGGTVETLAGLGGNSGSADGTGTEALFDGPYGVAVDTVGNLVVADLWNDSIRKVTSAGVVSTIAGVSGGRNSHVDGTGEEARFDYPKALTADRAGNVYVADTLNHVIRKITTAGVTSTLAGQVGEVGLVDGVGSNARFGESQGITVDDEGTIFVADSSNHAIRMLDQAGVVSTIAGSLLGNSGNADGFGTDATFNFPTGIAATRAGNLYVSDTRNHSIRLITKTVSQSNTNWVVSTIVGGNDDYNPFPLDKPGGIAVDLLGNIYVAEGVILPPPNHDEPNRHTIRVVWANGLRWLVSPFVGLQGQDGFSDGVGEDGRFNVPRGLTVDAEGNVFVAVMRNQRIKRVSPNGEVVTIGGESASGSADGTGTEARFWDPEGIAVDQDGNLFVADTRNNTIRKGVFTSFEVAISPDLIAPATVSLKVVLETDAEESESIGQWRLPWEQTWRGSGDAVTGLIPGNYYIEFRPEPGWIVFSMADPIPVGNLVDDHNATDNPYVHLFYKEIDAGLDAGASALLSIDLGTPPSGGGWRFVGNDSNFFGNTNNMALRPGTYLIEFARITGYLTPQTVSVELAADGNERLSVRYLKADEDEAPSQFLYPTPVGDVDAVPYQYVGQLSSGAGYGSGVAVQTNVVLTAGHLVFDDQTKSYVSDVHWYWRRNGDTTVSPLRAESYYLLSGYAAQRTDDLDGDASPGVSSSLSRNLDVAALYFENPVAGRGHGGYLPSDNTPNTWLTSGATKMLVGYPIDGSRLGKVKVYVNGQMYATAPNSRPLKLSVDDVPGQEQQHVYESDWLLGFPGNSGGPLYVNLNGKFYPAGVYLGEKYIGTTPVSSFVRGIDSDVVNLIKRAQAEGVTSGNSTGGGVVTFLAVPTDSYPLGAVRVEFDPPEVEDGIDGARWRVISRFGDGFETSAWYTAQAAHVGIGSTEDRVEFKEVPGWSLPPDNDLDSLHPSEPTLITAPYTRIDYNLLFNPNSVPKRWEFPVPIGSQLEYLIESTTSLPASPSDWIELDQTPEAGIITIQVNDSGQRFYRLKVQ